MPIYEYKCTKCGEVFETIQKFSDKPLKHCKFCHGKVEKLISNTSFQLRGSGWYLTDYARKSSGAAGDTGEKSPEKAPEKAKETATAPKPEKSATSKDKE